MYLGACVRSPDDGLEPVINEVPNIGLTLDVGHANLDGSGNKSIAIVEKFGKLIRQVHLHDNSCGQSLKQVFTLSGSTNMFECSVEFSQPPPIPDNGRIALSLEMSETAEVIIPFWINTSIDL
jgi:sugar phosphate isomerase/epimerase